MIKTEINYYRAFHKRKQSICQGGKLNRRPLLFVVFWSMVCDDEAELVVVSVGADPYHSSSHGFCQMELLVAICEPQHSEVESTSDRTMIQRGLNGFKC